MKLDDVLKAYDAGAITRDEMANLALVEGAISKEEYDTIYGQPAPGTPRAPAEQPAGMGPGEIRPPDMRPEFTKEQLNSVKYKDALPKNLRDVSSLVNKYSLLGKVSDNLQPQQPEAEIPEQLPDIASVVNQYPPARPPQLVQGRAPGAVLRQGSLQQLGGPAAISMAAPLEEAAIRPESSKDLSIGKRIDRTVAGTAGTMLADAGEAAILAGRYSERAGLGYKNLSDQLGQNGALELLGKFYEASGRAGQAGGEIAAGAGRDLAEKMAYEDPQFLDKLTAGLTSSAVFYLPAFGVMKGVQALALAPKLAVPLGITTNVLLESAIEAGNTRAAAIARGLTPDEADAKARNTFLANIPIITLTDKLGVFARTATPAGKFARTMLVNAGQEALQQVPQNVAAGNKVTAGMGESAFYGGLAAAPFGVMESMVAPPIVQARKNLPENVLRQGIDLLKVDPVAALRHITTPADREHVNRVADDVFQEVYQTEGLSDEQKQAETQRRLAVVFYEAVGQFPAGQAALTGPGMREQAPAAEKPAPEAVQGPAQGQPEEQGQDIYIDREPAAVYFQAQNIDPDQAFARLGAAPEDIRAAKAAGGRVRVKLADYSRAVQGTDINDALADHIALSPDELTIAREKAVKAETEQAAAAVKAKLKDESDLQTAVDAFKADIMKMGTGEKKAAELALAPARQMLYLARVEGKTISAMLETRPGIVTREEYHPGAVPAAALAQEGKEEGAPREQPARPELAPEAFEKPGLAPAEPAAGGETAAAGYTGGESPAVDKYVAAKAADREMKPEKVAAAPYVKDSDVLEIITGQAKDISYDKKQVRRAIRTHSPIINRSTGWRTIITDKGAKKLTDLDRLAGLDQEAQKAYWAALAELPEVYGRARLLYSHEARDQQYEHVHRLISVFRSGGKDYLVQFNVLDGYQEARAGGKVSDGQKRLHAQQIVGMRIYENETPGTPMHTRDKYSVAEALGFVKPGGEPLLQAAGPGENARGIYDVARNLIVRGEQADASTYWHEFSHYYLEQLFRVARAGRGDEQFRKDWGAIARWLEIADGQEKLTTEQQELFARGSEAYLRGDDYAIEEKGGKFRVLSEMTGNELAAFGTKEQAERWRKRHLVRAPSRELKDVFARLRRWLVAVYKSIRELNVQLPEDVREVFDRMMAAEDSLARAEREAGAGDTMRILTPAEQARLQAIQDEAHNEAVNLMTQHLLREVTREAKAERAALRGRLEAEAARSIKKGAVWQALDKLGAAARDQAADYIKGTLGRQETIRLKLVAEELGYTSADELARVIAATPDVTALIKDSVDQALADKDTMLDPGRLAAKAEELVHGERWLEVLALEKRLARDKMFSKEIKAAWLPAARREASVEAAEIRARAHDMLLDEENIKDAIRPDRYVAREREAAQKAAVALDHAKKSEGEGNKTAYDRHILEYVVAKNQQQMAHALYAQSLKLDKAMRRAGAFVDRLTKKPLETVRDQDAFNHMAELMNKFKLPWLKGYVGKKKESLREYVRKINAVYGDPLDPKKDDTAGIVQVADWIYESPGKSYLDCTAGEYLDIMDALRSLAHGANRQHNAFKIRNKAEISAIAGELAAAAYKNNKAHGQKVMDTGVDRALHLAKDYLYSLAGGDQLTQKLDGYVDGGVWQEVFMDTMHDAADREDRLMLEYRDKMKETWAGSYTPQEAKDIFTKKIYIEELEISIPRCYLLGMGLNMGALENRAKLFDNPMVGLPAGVKWDEDVVNQVLGKYLTEKDCRFIQGAIDVINGLWPQISEMNRRLTGYEPLKVEAVPWSLKLAAGNIYQFRGGYYPLVADTRAWTRAGERAAMREMADTPLHTEQNPSYRAMTRTGYTKRRTSASYTLSLDLGVIDRHLRDVIHDLCFRELIFDQRRLLADQGVQVAAKSTLGTEALRAWQLHINSSATGANAEKLSSDFISKLARWAGRRASTVMIMGKVAVIAQNVANAALAGTAVEGFSSWDTTKAILFRGLGQYWRPGAFANLERNQMLQFIWEKSPFMRAKRMTPDYSISDVKSGHIGDQAAMTETAKEFFIGLMAGTDDLVNVPVWLEAYNKRLRAGDEDAAAVRYADRLVQRISGSGRKYDQAVILKGTDLQKMFAKFYSFFNVEYANWARNLGQLQKEPIKNVPRFIGFAASRVVFIYLSALLRGGLPDKDKDKYLAWWAREYATYPMAFFPIVREIGLKVTNNALGLPDYGYRPPPVFTGFEMVGRAAGDLVKYARGDKELAAMLESQSKGGAYLAGYPDQLNILFWNTYDMLVNDMKPKPRDLMARRPKKERKKEEWRKEW